MSKLARLFRWSVCGLLPLLIAGTASAQVTQGNIVIYRVGDGAAALSNVATAVFIDEYTPAGTFVQSFPAPTTGATALTAVGNATTEGIISISQNGAFLSFGGYRKDAGGTNPSADAPATTNRLIGTINLAGTLDTSSYSLTNPTGTLRSAASTDGSTFYVGTSTQVGYVATPGVGTTVTATIDARNSRQVLLADNVLFASNGSTSITGKVQSYGTLPTSVTAPTVVANLATTDAVNGFILLDLNGGIAGVDTLYALSTVESRLRKYTFDGTNWLSNGFITTSASNLTGFNDGTDVRLYLTTGTTLSTLNDLSGINGTLSGSLTSLATAGTNTGFRGLGVFTPVPEPTSILAMCGIAGLAGTKIRRRWKNSKAS